MPFPGNKNTPCGGAGVIEGVWIVGLMLYPIFPIIRLSVKICDGDCQDFFFSDLVYDTVREAAGLTPSRSL